MKALFFGLGSIGRRHMRLLLDYFPGVEIWHYNRGDYFREICPTFEKFVDRTRWKPLPCIVSPDDFAIISTPSEAHLETSLSAAEMGLHLFIEKPVAVTTKGLSELIGLVKVKNLIAYVAYPLRFHPFIQHLKANLPAGGMHFECRSDASKWPSKRKLNHVILELSHELDLSQYLLGGVRRIRGNCSPDGLRAEITIEHDAGVVSDCTLDMASPDEARFIRVGGHEYPLEVNDYLYLSQLIAFMTKPESNLEQAAELLGVMEEFIGIAHHDMRQAG